MASGRDWALALVLARGFAFTGLNHPLRASDEPRVAGIGWEMQHANQRVPHLGGEPFLEHPPLAYAILGGFIEAFGASETVARLPGAIASATTLLIVFALGTRLANPTAGLCAILALVGCSGFFRYSHRVLVDPWLMLFVAAGYSAYVRAVWGTVGDRLGRVSVRWLMGIYASAALAFWVKGPVGIVVLGGPIALDALWNRRWNALLSPAHLVGAPLLLAACAAWPIFLHHDLGTSGVREFLVQNGLYRIVPGLGNGAYVGGHRNAPWYYLTRAPEMIGWVIVFVPAMAAWLRRGDLPGGWQTAPLRFLAWVFPLGLFLLSIPGTKRGLYLLPFLPPLAVSIGAWLAATAIEDTHRSRVEAITVRGCSALVSLAVRPFAFITATRSGRPVDGEPAERREFSGPIRVAQTAFALSMVALFGVVPSLGLGRDLGPIAREVGARVGGSQLFGYSLDEGMKGAVGFYTGRSAKPVDSPTSLAPAHLRLEKTYLLAPLFQSEAVEGSLPGRTRILRTWTGGKREYRLYEIDSGPPRAAFQGAPVLGTSTL